MSLSFPHIRAVAQTLGVEPCAVGAVVEVESAGSGFLPSGRVKILFEGHIFWKELQKFGINPADINAPGILHPRWDRGKYKGGEQEWNRMEAAAAIHQEAALASASWGLFQIMGFNYAACGFAGIHDFVRAQKKDEAAQLSAFCAFLQSQNLLRFLKARDWEAFARRYNGPAYAENDYHRKLARAYRQCLARGGEGAGPCSVGAGPCNAGAGTGCASAYTSSGAGKGRLGVCTASASLPGACAVNGCVHCRSGNSVYPLPLGQAGARALVENRP
ncbi:N-acetylmuramidase family protein [Desulfovibrio sp. OttesenSCG-928-A18]|nr:N-acetylmuramidase family protein [Desulfovibrio sp. OttesenSCG-928-A18]